MRVPHQTDLRGRLQRANRIIGLQRMIIAAVGDAPSFRDLAQLFLDEICGFTAWPVGHAYFLAEGSDDLLLPSGIWHLAEPARFESFRQVTRLTPLPRGKGLPGRVLESGKPAWIVDVNRDPNFPRNKLAIHLGIKAGFAFPIVVEKQVIGVLEFYSREALEPDRQLLALMESFGGQLGLLFQRQKAQDELVNARDSLLKLVKARTEHLAEMNDSLQLEMIDRRRAEEELRSQNRVLELIARGTAQAEVFGALLESIEALEPGVVGSILLLDSSGERLRHAAAPHLPTEYNSAIDGGRIGPKAGSCGTAAHLGRRIVVENIETDPLWDDYRALALRHGLRACWSQPFFARDGAVLGTFAMYYHSPRKPTPTDLRVLDTAAKLAEVAVERDRLERNLKSTLIDLEKTNLELEQFVFVTSHDLQEPLRMVTTYLQYLEKLTEGRLGAEEHRAVDFAIKGAMRMREMIQSLLAYARTWREPQSVERAALGRLVEQALENLKTTVEQTGARITVGELPTLSVNPLRMVQLFQNLIGNALKYRGEQTPEIRIDAEEKEPEWVFSVRDNGIGIEPGHADRLFTIFQRLHGDREKYPGTGIGLAICKKIVERHGGRIWVESVPGKGATFRFSLPSRA